MKNRRISTWPAMRCGHAIAIGRGLSVVTFARAEATTAAVVTVEGGNIAAALR